METLKHRLCCCLYKEKEDKYRATSVRINNDTGAITVQPGIPVDEFDKPSNRNGVSNGAFVDEKPEFDDIDLNERVVVNHQKPVESSEYNEEAINVTGLMLDNLYDNESFDNNSTEPYREVEDNVITEASDNDVRLSQTAEIHKITVMDVEDHASIADAVMARVLEEALEEEEKELLKQKKLNDQEEPDFFSKYIRGHRPSQDITNVMSSMVDQVEKDADNTTDNDSDGSFHTNQDLDDLVKDQKTVTINETPISIQVDSDTPRSDFTTDSSSTDIVSKDERRTPDNLSDNHHQHQHKDKRPHVGMYDNLDDSDSE